MSDQPTALYRLYDATGALLYVGITSDPERRFKQHAYLKPWWGDVARREIRWFANRPAAERAEVEAIQDDDPLHNGTHSPSRARRINRDAVDEAGVRHISLSRARTQWNDVVDQAMNGTPTALLNYGRPHAFLVTPEFYERALALGADKES
ncbi:GIY-YIG nuclease family protein [Streptomyces cellulosae]